MKFSKGETLKLIVTGQNIAGKIMPIGDDIVADNKGNHIIHTGGRYDSQLYLQFIKKQ